MTEDIKSKIIPTDLVMIEHLLYNKEYDFKEFVMQETEDPTKLKVIYLK